MDRAGRGATQSSRHASLRRPGSHCQGKEAEGGSGDTVHGSGSVDGDFVFLQGSGDGTSDLSVQSVCDFFSTGTFAECSCETEVQYWMRYNIFLLLDVGTFSALVELLNMEIEYVLLTNIS